jgi:hypothetical protein
MVWDLNLSQHETDFNFLFSMCIKAVIQKKKKAVHYFGRLLLKEY